MTTELSVASIHRRFLVLTAARWLPVGLWIPVIVLFTLDRGLTLAQFGAVAAVQGLVVLGLELPTGGLADSIGRRRVLLMASAVSIVSTGVYLLATNPTAFLVAFALQGVYRALDSGPLEAWYVDATLAADPTAPIERGLSAAGVALGVSIALGAVAAGGLVAMGGIGPVDALAVPIVVSLAMQVVALVAVAVLMTETRPAPGTGGPRRAVLGTGTAIRDGLRLLRWSPVLMALVAVELTWGFGMVAFESLFPVRLDEIVGSENEAAAILGPVAAAAWLASSAGAATVPWLGRRMGMAPAAALMRVLQGLSVVGMALAAGVVGAVTAYLVCYAIHGASNPAHRTLVHSQVHGPLRATVVSLNSMAAQPAGALGLLVLPAVAGTTSVSAAMYVAAGVLALGSLLYIPAWRQAVTARHATPTGDQVRVRLVKAVRPDVEYDGEVIADDGVHIVVHGPWAEPEARDLGFVTFERGDGFTEHYWRDRWYSVKEVRDQAGALKGWYCDVARPARVEDGLLISEDLDLDLWVSANGQTVLRLDEDEFAANGLAETDPEAASRAWEALTELERLAADGFRRLE